MSTDDEGEGSLMMRWMSLQIVFSSWFTLMGLVIDISLVSGGGTPILLFGAIKSS